MRRLITLVSLAALVLGALGGCGWGDSDDGESDEAAVEATVDAYVAALRDGDPEAVCELVTQAELDDLAVTGSCVETFAAGFDLLGEQGVEIPEYEISGVVVDGDRGEATLVSGTTEEVVPLAMEDGEWKLAGATSIDQFHPDDPLRDGPPADDPAS